MPEKEYEFKTCLVVKTGKGKCPVLAELTARCLAVCFKEEEGKMTPIVLFNDPVYGCLTSRELNKLEQDDPRMAP